MNIVFLSLYLHFAIGLLEKSDLDVIASELDAISSKWYTLGLELLAERYHHRLDSIRTILLQNAKDGLGQMLRMRMCYYPTTWMDIIAGVRSSGDSQLADHLETKYCYVVVNSLEQYFVSKWSASLESPDDLTPAVMSIQVVG